MCRGVLPCFQVIGEIFDGQEFNGRVFDTISNVRRVQCFAQPFDGLPIFFFGVVINVALDDVGDTRPRSACNCRVVGSINGVASRVVEVSNNEGD